MEEKRKVETSSVINVHLYNGTFVKLRKVKKQVLQEQNFEQLYTIPTQAISFTNSKMHVPLHTVRKINLDGLNGKNTNTISDALKKPENRIPNSQQGINGNKQYKTKEQARNTKHNGNGDAKELNSIVVNGHFNDKNVGNTSVTNLEPHLGETKSNTTPNSTCNCNVDNVIEDINIVRKTSAILTKDVGKVCRRDSVVAMSTRKMSLVNTAQKSKIRKTSFVAPRSNLRRKSSVEQRTKAPEKTIHRKDIHMIQHKQMINVETRISGDKTVLIVDVDSIVSSLQSVCPSSTIEIVSPSGQYLFTTNIQADDKDNKNTTVMPPRNESPMPVYNELNITDIISDLKRKQNDVTSLIDFCRKMAMFAFDDSLKVLLAKQEGISHIIKAMNKHKENRDLVEAACSTLLKMTTFSDANCILIYKENGIVLLTELLKHYIDEAELLLIILDICGQLAMSEDTNVTDSLLDNSCHHTVLTVMSRHGNNVLIVKQCCFILSHLVNTVEIARSLMFIGCVHVIIGVMQKYKENNDILANGCRVLGGFAVHDDLCMDVANAGAVPVVLNALERSIDDEDLLECSTWGLACLTKYDEACQGIHHTDAVQHLIKGMKKYPNKETIQEYGCWSICNIVAHDSKSHTFLGYGIIKILLDAISFFKENIDLQEQIMFTLSNIITLSDSFLHQFTENNGIALTIKSMQLYPDHNQIQEYGCRIIGNVAVYDKHRMCIESAGGSKVVVNAMLMFNNCTDIQEVGCLTLTNITANVYRNKVSAVKNGCVTAVLNALSDNKESDEIVLSGLKTLCNVIEIDEACYNFIEEDGLNILSSVLNNRSIDKLGREIYLFAANALSRLSLILGFEEVYINETEKLLYVIKKVTKEDQEAVLCLCRFYENLLRSEKGYHIFCRGQGYDFAKMCIDDHLGDMNIQSSCCKIIAATCLYDKRCYTDQYHILRNVMQNFPHNCDIQMICCGALVYIADNNETEREYLVKEDAVTSVLTAIKTHKCNEKMVDVGLMALDVLLNKHDVIEDSRCILQLIPQLLHAYPDNVEIQIHGLKLISKLLTQHDAIEVKEESVEKTCEHIVDVMKKRRSNGELQTAAMEALQTLMTDQPEYLVQKIKDQLPLLNWLKG